MMMNSGADTITLTPLIYQKIYIEEAFEEQIRAYNAQQRGEPEGAKLRAMDGKQQRGTIRAGETQGKATLAVSCPGRQEGILFRLGCALVILSWKKVKNGKCYIVRRDTDHD